MGLCTYYCYFGPDFLLPDTMSKQERPAFRFGDPGLQRPLAHGVPLPPSLPLWFPEKHFQS